VFVEDKIKIWKIPLFHWSREFYLNYLIDFQDVQFRIENHRFFQRLYHSIYEEIFDKIDGKMRNIIITYLTKSPIRLSIDSYSSTASSCAKLQNNI
jgi:hypothetical protein